METYGSKIVGFIMQVIYSPGGCHFTINGCLAVCVGEKKKMYCDSMPHSESFWIKKNSVVWRLRLWLHLLSSRS